MASLPTAVIGCDVGITLSELEARHVRSMVKLRNCMLAYAEQLENSLKEDYINLVKTRFGEDYQRDLFYDFDLPPPPLVEELQGTQDSCLDNLIKARFGEDYQWDLFYEFDLEEEKTQELQQHHAAKEVETKPMVTSDILQGNFIEHLVSASAQKVHTLENFVEQDLGLLPFTNSIEHVVCEPSHKVSCDSWVSKSCCPRRSQFLKRTSVKKHFHRARLKRRMKLRDWKEFCDLLNSTDSGGLLMELNVISSVGCKVYGLELLVLNQKLQINRCLSPVWWSCESSMVGSKRVSIGNVIIWKVDKMQTVNQSHGREEAESDFRVQNKVLEDAIIPEQVCLSFASKEIIDEMEKGKYVVAGYISEQGLVYKKSCLILPIESSFNPKVIEFLESIMDTRCKMVFCWEVNGKTWWKLMIIESQNLLENITILESERELNSKFGSKLWLGTRAVTKRKPKVIENVGSEFQGKKMLDSYVRSLLGKWKSLELQFKNVKKMCRWIFDKGKMKLRIDVGKLLSRLVNKLLEFNLEDKVSLLRGSIDRVRIMMGCMKKKVRTKGKKAIADMKLLEQLHGIKLQVLSGFKELTSLEGLQSCAVVCNIPKSQKLMVNNEETLSFVKKFGVRSKTALASLSQIQHCLSIHLEDKIKLSRGIRVMKWDVKKRHRNTEIITGYLKSITPKFSGLDILDSQSSGKIIFPSNLVYIYFIQVSRELIIGCGNVSKFINCLRELVKMCLSSVTRKEEANKGTRLVKFFVDQFFQMFHLLRPPELPSYEEVSWMWSLIKYGSSEKEKRKKVMKSLIGAKEDYKWRISNSRGKTLRCGLCEFARSFQLEDKLVLREGSIDTTSKETMGSYGALSLVGHFKPISLALKVVFSSLVSL